MADLKRLFPFHTNEWMAVEFECSPRTVVRRAREWGLEKDPDWLQHKWDKNREMAHRINHVCGNKADLTNFIEGGKKYRFTSENHPSRTTDKEVLSARMKKAWVTRKRNRLYGT